jgi:hypothetical protein
MAYMDLIRKLEKRFGFRELPETAQVQFNNAHQTPEELLEDWADPVLSYSLMAMLMPPHFVYGLFNVFRPDIGCIASGFFICCPLAEPHYRLVVHVLFGQFSKCSSG